MTQNNLIFEPYGKVEIERLDGSVVLAKEVVVATSKRSVLYAHQMHIDNVEYSWLYADSIKIKGDCLCSRVIGEQVEVWGKVLGGQVAGARVVQIGMAGFPARLTRIEVKGNGVKKAIVELNSWLKHLEKEIKKAKFWLQITGLGSSQLDKLISEFELFANLSKLLTEASPCSLVIHKQLQPPLRLAIGDYELLIEQAVNEGLSLILEGNEVKVSKIPSKPTAGQTDRWRLLPQRVRVGTKACDLNVGDVIKIERIYNGKFWQWAEEIAQVMELKRIYNGKLYLKLSLKDVTGDCIIASNIKVRKIKKGVYQRI